MKEEYYIYNTTKRRAYYTSHSCGYSYEDVLELYDDSFVKIGHGTDFIIAISNYGNIITPKSSMYKDNEAISWWEALVIRTFGVPYYRITNHAIYQLRIDDYFYWVNLDPLKSYKLCN